MKLLSWLDALSGTADSGTVGASRRAALARLGRAALATAPLLAGAATVTAGPPLRVTSFVTDALNLLLRVAYPQQALLAAALAAGGTPFPDAAARTAFEQQQVLLNNLINRLRTSVGASGDAVEAPRAYDLTGNASTAGGGPLNPRTSYADFLVLAQVFADVLSRTLLSTLPTLGGNTVFAELSGQLLGTTSRLAASARRRRQLMGTAVQPWIVEAEDAATLPPLFTTQTKPYEGENTTLVFSILELTAVDAPMAMPPVYAVLNPVPARAVLTAAFDQPLALVAPESLPQGAVAQLLTPFWAL